MRYRVIHLFVLAALSVAALSAGCRANTPGAAAGNPPLLPTPPRQTAPWSPPAGDDARGLSPAILTATATLFSQGLADPRGGEYRKIAVQVGNVWRGDGEVVETRGWVFPGETDGKRYAACWNGLVYPVVAERGNADLRADCEKTIGKYDRALSDERRWGFGFTEYWSNAAAEPTSLAVEYPSPLKIAYLLRLGENDLARKLYALWEKGTPPNVNGNNEILRDPYLLMATQWAWSAYDRAICAHMRGADRLSANDTALLTRVRPSIEAEADKRNYRTYPGGGIYEKGSPHLSFLLELPALHRDSLRRLSEKPRPPLDWDALKKQPQPARIAELIRRLDEIAARQWEQPDGVGLDADPIAEALIAEGAPAVDSLLDVLESDDRLTRSVGFWRDFKPERNLLTVKSAAFRCFTRINDGARIEGSEESVAALREWWAKNKGVAPADRWLADLADDGPATPPVVPAPSEITDEGLARYRRERDMIDKNRTRWTDAASRIVERAGIERHGGWMSSPDRKPNESLPPFKGERLRPRRNPSVSDLLRKRALSLSEKVERPSGYDYVDAATLALILYEWEPKGPDTLPTLQEVMRRCVRYQQQVRTVSGHSTDQEGTSRSIACLTLARLRLGDSAGGAEYGKWLRTVSPRYLEHDTLNALLPLWRMPDDPRMRRIADSLFSQEHGVSAWSGFLADPRENDMLEMRDLPASDMLRLPAFRALILRRLGDKTEAGVAMTRAGGVSFLWRDGAREGTGHDGDSELPRQTQRTCDRVAHRLQSLAGIPRFDPLAPVARRDTQCAAIVAYLKRYGPILGHAERSDLPLHSGIVPSSFDYLGPAYPDRKRPATEADVRENRAIFSLSGGNARVVADLPAPLPLEAEWPKDPRASFAVGAHQKKTPYSRGYIWQAEELYNGREWVRYYGYVGPHSIARVPASEIEITDSRARKPPAAPGAAAKR